MPIRTILIDDEYLAIAELTHMLQTYPEIEIIDQAQDGNTALEQIRKHQPDLIFLDISMPEKDGFELLADLDEAPMVVFVTAYDQYAIKAFEVNALDYLLKPVNKERLKEVVQKIKGQIAKRNTDEDRVSIHKKIFIKDGDRCFFLALQEIEMLESAGNYVKVIYKNQKPLLHRSLNYMETKLPEDHFFRANRQHIVNINFIKNVDASVSASLQIEMQNGQMIDISQRQSVKFKEIMGI